MAKSRAIPVAAKKTSGGSVAHASGGKKNLRTNPKGVRPGRPKGTPVAPQHINGGQNPPSDARG